MAPRSAPTNVSTDAAIPRARSLLADAELAATPADRFTAALTAADLVAGAVVRFHTSQRSRADVWRTLASAIPEFGEWAAFFAACQHHSRPDRSISVTARQADDLVRDAHRFEAEVTRWIARHRSMSARGSA